MLLCRPDHYGWIPTNAIARATLASGTPMDRAALMAEYAEFEAALGQAGVACHYLTPEAHLPYQVYTRDSSQVSPLGPVLTMLAMPQRRGEYASVLKFYGTMWKMATAGTVEGGDIHLIRPGLAAIGKFGRAHRTGRGRAICGLAAGRGVGGDRRALRRPFPASGRDLFDVRAGAGPACPDALPPAFLDWLRDHQIRLIEVGYRAAMADMACNVLALGAGPRAVAAPFRRDQCRAARRGDHGAGPGVAAVRAWRRQRALHDDALAARRRLKPI